MSSEELIKINVSVGGRTYPLKVPKKDEQFVKTIEKEINSKISEMRRSFEMEDIDHISMAMLSFVYEMKNNERQTHSSLDESINQIASIVKSAL